LCGLVCGTALGSAVESVVGGGVGIVATTLGSAIVGAVVALPVKNTIISKPIESTAIPVAIRLHDGGGWVFGVASDVVVVSFGAVAPTAFKEASSVACTGSGSSLDRKPTIFPATSRIGIELPITMLLR
jgi:outer membrane lipoprotein SlyB